MGVVLPVFVVNPKNLPKMFSWFRFDRYPRNLDKEYLRIWQNKRMTSLVMLFHCYFLDPLTFPAKACCQDPAYDCKDAVVAPASVKSWASNLAEPSEKGVSDIEAMCFITS